MASTLSYTSLDSLAKASIWRLCSARRSRVDTRAVARRCCICCRNKQLEEKVGMMSVLSMETLCCLLNI